MQLITWGIWAINWVIILERSYIFLKKISTILKHKILLYLF